MLLRKPQATGLRSSLGAQVRRRFPLGGLPSDENARLAGRLPVLLGEGHSRWQDSAIVRTHDRDYLPIQPSKSPFLAENRHRAYARCRLAAMVLPANWGDAGGLAEFLGHAYAQSPSVATTSRPTGETPGAWQRTAIVRTHNPQLLASGGRLGGLVALPGEVTTSLPAVPLSDKGRRQKWDRRFAAGGQRLASACASTPRASSSRTSKASKG